MDVAREMPALYEVLEAWVLDNATPADAKAFHARWQRVRPGVDRLPCPNCFLEGDDHPLAPRDVEDGALVRLRPWVCAHCSERYDVPVEDKT